MTDIIPDLWKAQGLRGMTQEFSVGNCDFKTTGAERKYDLDLQLHY
jgi:hypothetical protein